MELYTLWSTIWFGCLLFWCLDFGGVCHSSLHRSLIMTGSSSRPQVWLCGKLNYSNLPMDVSIVNCLGVGSLGVFCGWHFCKSRVSFCGWPFLIKSRVLFSFFIACFVRGPVCSMVHPHKLSFPGFLVWHVISSQGQRKWSASAQPTALISHTCTGTHNISWTRVRVKETGWSIGRFFAGCIGVVSPFMFFLFFPWGFYLLIYKLCSDHFFVAWGGRMNFA